MPARMLPQTDSSPLLTRLLSLFLKLGPLLTLVLLVLAVSIASPDFRKPENFFNIVNQMSFVGIVAVGMTWVIILGGVDLSVGSAVALLGGLGIQVMNLVAQSSGSPALGIAAGVSVMLLGGPLLGLVNGGVIVLGRVAPFIVTVGTMAAYRSIILYRADGGEIRSAVSAFGDFGSSGLTLPFIQNSRGRAIELGWPTITFLSLAFFAEFLLRRTVLGRWVFAVGGNAVAARYAGVPVGRVNLIVYAFCGLMCGVAAILTSARLNSIASASIGQMYELDAIAAVVVGGASMNGGRGSVLGTVIGVLLLGVIGNTMTMLSIENHIQGLVKGCIIIGAVLIQRLQRAG